MLPTVAVVEDEDDLRDAIVEYLQEKAWHAVPAANGAALRELVMRDGVPDVVILDVAMPGENGFALARWLRSFGARPGIVFATAYDTPPQRTVGLELGADDYVTKPYDLRELGLRLSRVFARLPAATAKARAAPDRADPSLRFGNIVLSRASRTAMLPNGRQLSLTSSEFDLLLAFAAHPGRTFSRESLAKHATNGRESEVHGRGIDIRIARLRKKLRSVAVDDSLIRTVKGEGYCFEPPCDSSSE